MLALAAAKSIIGSFTRAFRLDGEHVGREGLFDFALGPINAPYITCIGHCCPAIWTRNVAVEPLSKALFMKCMPAFETHLRLRRRIIRETDGAVHRVKM